MKRRDVPASGPNVSNLDGALAALNAEDLRDLIRTAISRFDDNAFSWFADAVIERASSGRAGWKPSVGTIVPPPGYFMRCSSAFLRLCW